MKKVIVMMVVFLFGAVLLSGCATSSKVESPLLKNEFENAPEWVTTGGGSVEGVVSAIGSAKVGPAGMNFARTEALSNGRSELARQISTRVKDMVKNFTQTTGVGDDETVDKVSAQVSKQVTNQMLSGTKQKDSWISPSSTYYALMVIDPLALKSSVKDSVMTSYKNDKALWQQFQAKKAYEELEKEIEKEFSEQ
jgi:hypothetical protein